MGCCERGFNPPGKLSVAHFFMKMEKCHFSQLLGEGCERLVRAGDMEALAKGMSCRPTYGELRLELAIRKE